MLTSRHHTLSSGLQNHNPWILHSPCRCNGINAVRPRDIRVPTATNGGGESADINEQKEKLDKLSKISGGQYLFNRVREKAEQKIGRVVNRSRVEWLESEKKELVRPPARLDDNSVLIGAPIIALKAFMQTAVMRVFYWPFSFLLRAVAAVSAQLQPYFNAEQFEMFMMSEGEQIWRWRNRTQNERWFWQFFLFRSLIPTVVGITVYEAFVPNNIMWAVLLPYLFYYAVFRTILNPWMFDWWLVMYFGLYCKCWPAIAGFLQWLFL